MFVVKWLLLTALFLSSRKQYEYVTHIEKRFIDQEIYHKLSYGSDVPSETYPPPHPPLSLILKHLEFTFKHLESPPPS